MQSTEDYYSHQQNEEDGGGFRSCTTVNRFAMLNLNNTSTFPTTTTVPLLPSSAVNRCTTCGSSSSIKRRSPSSSSFQEPTAKKQLLTLLTTPLSSSATANLSPPINTHITPPSSAPVLRRCISDPVNSPGTTQFLTPPSAENANTVVYAATPCPEKGTASLPPFPRALRRSVSDPLYRSPNSGELGSGSNMGGESPSLKRLKRMKDQIGEMIQWWGEIMREDGGEENNNGVGNCINSTITEVDCAETETEEGETEEAVSVESRGDCLVINFKCPCKKGYQILLSGNNCYYKL